MKNPKKAIAILSSGLDSAVNLAWGSENYEIVRALTFDYGQRAAKRESECANRLTQRYNIPHEILFLPYLVSWTKSSLVNKSLSLPSVSPHNLQNKEATQQSAKAVWVPNRNAIFINIAAALAESLQANHLIVGFNVEEGNTFPDNSPSFVKAINKSLSFSTLNHVTVVCKTLTMNKKEIVRLGVQLDLPFEFVWSCYEGGKQMCGECESCLRLKRAASEEAPELLEVFSFAN